MIIVMKADIPPGSPAVAEVVRMIGRYPGVRTEVREIQGACGYYRNLSAR